MHAGIILNLRSRPGSLAQTGTSLSYIPFLDWQLSSGAQAQRRLGGARGDALTSRRGLRRLSAIALQVDPHLSSQRDVRPHPQHVRLFLQQTNNLVHRLCPVFRDPGSFRRVFRVLSYSKRVDCDI